MICLKSNNKYNCKEIHRSIDIYVQHCGLNWHYEPIITNHAYMRNEIDSKLYDVWYIQANRCEGIANALLLNAVNSVYKLLFVAFIRYSSMRRQFLLKQLFYLEFDLCGPNRVSGKTEDHGYVSVKKVKTLFLAK